MTTSPNGITADKEIADRITNAIIVKNLNVKAISDETGISYPTLRRSLKGGRSFTIAELERIANAINIPTSALLPEYLTRTAA